MRKLMCLAVTAFVVIFSGCEELGEDTRASGGGVGIQADGTYRMYSNGAFYDNDIKDEFDGIQVWDTPELGEHVNFVSTAGKGHTGGTSIEIVVNNADGSGGWRTVAFLYGEGVPTSEVVFMSFWAKVPVGLPAVTLAAGFGRFPQDDSDTFKQERTGISIPADGQWHRRVVKIEIPIAVIKFSSITLYTAPFSMVYIDDIEFCPYIAGGLPDEEEL